MTSVNQEINRRSYMEPSGRLVEIIYEDQRRLDYANNVQLRASLVDFIIEFGISIESTEERLLIKNISTVAMSPQHAKAVAQLLSRHIERYEERFGKLPDEFELTDTDPIEPKQDS